MVKLPLVRMPFSVPPWVCTLFSAVGLVPQSITIWNVYEEPMSPFVKVLDSDSPRTFEPPVPLGFSWMTPVVRVNEAPPSSTWTALIWTCT